MLELLLAEMSKVGFEKKHNATLNVTKSFVGWIFGLVVVLIVSGAVSSGICWYVTDQTTRFALVDLTEQLQDEISNAVGHNLYSTMRPVEVMVKQAYEYAYQRSLNLSTVEGQTDMIPFVKAFLSTFLSEYRCCSGIFTNMEYYPPTSPLNNEEDLFWDDASMLVLKQLPDGSTRWFRPVNVSPPDKRVIGQVSYFDNASRLLPADYTSTEVGFVHWPRDNGFWYKTTRDIDNENRGRGQLAEGDFTFSRIFATTVNLPPTLVTQGILAIYDTDEVGVRPHGVGIGDSSKKRLVGSMIFGLKLHFFSTYLSQLTNVIERDGFIMYVEQSTGYYIASSDASIADMEELDVAVCDGSAPCPLLASDHPGSARVRAVASAAGVGPGRAEWGKRKVDIEGRESHIYVFPFTRFGLEWVGILEFPTTSIMESINTKVGSNIATGVLAVTGVNLVLFLLAMSGFFWKMWGLMKDKSLDDDRRITRAVQNMSKFAFPLVAIRADIFMSLGKLENHESCRDRGILTFFDTLSAMSERFIALYSHQWLGWSEADPSNSQYPKMVQATRELLALAGLRAEDLYIWVDTISIPQVSVPQVAVDTLPLYASLASALVVIAPEATHVNTLEVCNFKSYMQRCWCRAEQASHVLTHGLKHFFIMENDSLRRADADTYDFQEALFVFEGDLTCCQRKHPCGMTCDRTRLVDAMLGMCFKLVSTVNQGVADDELVRLHKFIVQRQARTFPAEVTIEVEKKGRVTLPLFGNLLSKMELRIRSGEFSQEGSLLKSTETAGNVIMGDGREFSKEFNLVDL